MVIYQFSNSLQVTFIVLFSILLMVSIVVGILCVPLVKLVFQKGNPMKARILLLPIIIIVYLFCISLFALSIKNISEYYSITRETDVEKCSVVTGEIEELEKFPQYSRGATLTSYYLKFRIGDEEYYIGANVGVIVEYIALWNEGDTITVYYQNINGKNSVIKAVKN